MPEDSFLPCPHTIMIREDPESADNDHVLYEATSIDDFFIVFNNSEITEFPDKMKVVLNYLPINYNSFMGSDYWYLGGGTFENNEYSNCNIYLYGYHSSNYPDQQKVLAPEFGGIRVTHTFGEVTIRIKYTRDDEDSYTTKYFYNYISGETKYITPPDKDTEWIKEIIFYSPVNPDGVVTNIEFLEAPVNG